MGKNLAQMAEACMNDCYYMRSFLHQIIFSVFFLTAIPAALTAQFITIGNGTGSTTSQPISTFYNYSASEMIYLASEMGTTANITSIAFDKASGNSTQEVNDVFIYMKMTTATDYGTGVTPFTTSLSGYTLVWSGNFPNAGTGWQTVTLNAPFQYNDLSKNLAVFVVNNSGAGIASGRPQYRYTTTSPVKHNGNFGTLMNSVPWTPAGEFTPVWERANVRFNTTPVTGCINPSNLAANNITANSADISWTGFSGNSPNGYDWEIRVSGDGGSGSTGLFVFGNTSGAISNATASGLTAGTNYKLYVRAKCTGSLTSTWTGPYDFTTACDIQTIPFSEGFNSNIRPSCWRQDYVAGPFSTDFTYPPTGTTPTATAFEGSNFLLFSSHTIAAGTKMRMVSPALKTQGVNSVDVEFEFFHSEELPNYPDSLLIQYSLDGTNWIEVPGGSVVRQNDIPGWSHKTITLPQGAANQPKIYVGFLFVSGFGYNCYVDDVQIKATGISCVAPSNIVVSNITAQAATISWTAPAIPPVNGYEWKIVAVNAGVNGTAILSGTTNSSPVAVSGLPGESQTYSVYVRSLCETTNSNWTAVVDFSTPCGSFTLPFKQDFSGYASQFPPNCWTSSDAKFIKASDASGFNNGHGSVVFNNYLAAHGNYDLELPITEPTTEGYKLIFNYAYAPYAPGDYADGLIIYYSTDAGSTYNELQNYNGGQSGSLVTGFKTAFSFLPRITEWGIKYIPLPVGTNRIKFTDVCKGGNNLYIDQVEIKIPENNIVIYPNPAKKYVMIKGVDMANATMIIRDITGRTVKMEKGKYVVDVSALSTGIYVATIYTEGTRFTQKIIVTH